MLVALLVTTSACSSGSNSGSETASSASGGTETLTVGTDPTYPPYQYIENNEFVGLELDTARAIGKAIGKEVKFENIKYTAGITALQANRFDVFMAGGTVDSPGRREQVTLIDEYDTSPGLMVKGKPRGARHQGEPVRASDLGIRSIGVREHVESHQRAVRE